MTKLCFFGESHAAQHLSQAARDKGFEIVPAAFADLIFVSEDTPTDADGNRDLQTIRGFVDAAKPYDKQIILTSAVPPGFCRSLGIPTLIHQAELLRMRDAAERAARPEMIMFGVDSLLRVQHDPMDHYFQYLDAFNCDVFPLTWESAEFAKMAINAALIQQVEFTNCMAGLAEKCGANWEHVAECLRHDSRIGPHAYLTPGRWEDSRHLLRDWVSLNQIEDL